VLGIIAMIFIGPKDMPAVLRKFGTIMQKVRGMAREFQGHVDVAMKDAGVADLKKDLQGMRSAVNDQMKMPALQATNSVAAPKKNDFEKFFGEAPDPGETRVAGRAVLSDTTS
jgi:sec-independent protein translocase protein TatB